MNCMMAKSRVRKRAPHAMKARTNGMMCFFMLTYPPDRNHEKKKINPMSTVVKSNGPAHGYLSCCCLSSCMFSRLFPVVD